MDYFAAIKTFVRAADLGSLTRAAQDLSIKTSTASRQLSELEGDLRIALFNRSTRGLALTEGGKVFYARVKDVLAQLDEAREATSALNLTPSGVLRVSMPGAFGRRHVMPYLGEFMNRFGDIDVDLVLSDDDLNLIESEVDLGIRMGVLEESSLMARRLAHQRCIVCAATGYIQDQGRPETPDDLLAHRCLLYSRAVANSWYARGKSGRGDRSERGGQSREWQKIPVDGRFTANDSDAILDAALSGMGIALLPVWLAHDAVRTGKLTELLPSWEFSPIRDDDAAIWAVYPPKRTVSSKVRSFIDFLAGKYGDVPYWER